MELYWTYSFRELQQKLQLKYGELSTIQLCQYNTMAQIISQALGGGTEDESAQGPGKGKSLEMAVAEINSLLQF